MALAQAKADELLKKKTDSARLQAMQNRVNAPVVANTTQSQHQANLAENALLASGGRQAPGAGSTLAQQAAFSQGISNQFGAQSGVGNTRGRLGGLDAVEAAKLANPLTSDFTVRNNEIVTAQQGRGSLTQAAINAQLARQKGAESEAFDSFLGTVDRSAIDARKQELQTLFDDATARGNDQQRRLIRREMNKLESGSVVNQLAALEGQNMEEISRGIFNALDSATPDQVRNIEASLVRQFKNTPEFQALAADKGMTADQLELEVRRKGFQGAGVDENSMSAARLAEVVQANKTPEELAKDAEREYNIRYKEDLNILDESKQKAFDDGIAAIKGRLGFTGDVKDQSASTQRLYESYVKNLEKKINDSYTESKKSLDLGLARSERAYISQVEAAQEKARLSAMQQSQKTPADLDREELENFISQQQAIDPTLSRAYLQNKWQAINKYEEGGGDKLHYEAFSQMFELGEIVPNDLAGMMSKATDLTGNEKDGKALIEAKFGSRIAQQAQEDRLNELGFDGKAVTMAESEAKMREGFLSNSLSAVEAIAYMDKIEIDSPDKAKRIYEKALENGVYADDPVMEKLLRARVAKASDDSVGTPTFDSRVKAFNDLPSSETQAVLRMLKKIFPGALSNDEREIMQAEYVKHKEEGGNLSSFRKMASGFDPIPKDSTDYRTKDAAQKFVFAKGLGRLDPADSQDINELIKLGQYDQAFGLMETKLTETVERDFNSDIVLRTAKDQSDALVKLVTDPESAKLLGLIEGNIEGFQLRVGVGSAEERVRAQKLASLMTTSVMEMRNQMLGSAVTETEEQFLQPILPKLTDQPAQIIGKTQDMVQALMDKHNSVRSIVRLPKLTQDTINNEARAQAYLNEALQLVPEQLEIDLTDVPSYWLDRYNEERGTSYSPAKNSPAETGQTNTDFLKAQEGFRSEAYLDSANVPTIGYGFTSINGRPVQLGDTITQEEAEAELLKQIARHSNYKNKITVDLTPQQEEALASFEYNLGPGIWDKDAQDIIEAVNNREFEKAGELMLQYNQVRDRETGEYKVVQGLTNRRKREAELLKHTG